MDTSNQHIDILLFDDFNLLDVAGPVEAFSNARIDGERVYSVRYASVDGQPVISSSGLRVVPDKKAAAGRAQSDLLVPGGCGVDAAIADHRINAYLKKWARLRQQQRCISICSGALLIAHAGLLDGLQATTHWTREAQASALLAEGLNTQRVQSKTGFSSDQSMQRAFKKHLGVTVGEYRQQFVTQNH